MAKRDEQVKQLETTEFRARSMSAATSENGEDEGAAAPDARATLSCNSCGAIAAPPFVLNCGHLTCSKCLASSPSCCPKARCGARVVCA